ncbi:MAG: helix-turn-helix transcriptional regulator [Actinomycetota bacterium]
MSIDPQLGQFLRSRRSRLQPGDVGLAGGGRRRVIGLRREEVAELACISTDYYLRIEQGREKAPSARVLDAIARALKLNEAETSYVHDLVRLRSVAPQPALPSSIDSLIEGWPSAAAHVHDDSLTVVSANAMAIRLSPTFGSGHNTLRNLFLENDARTFYRDWERLTEWAVAWLRSYTGAEPSPGLARVIAELTQESARFRDLWSWQRVRQDSNGRMLIDHPQVGAMDLHFQHMVLPATRHVLVVYWAEPHSSTDRKMRALRDR